MTHPSFERWLDAWGYQDAAEALHRSVEDVPAEHVYRRELIGLLDPQGAIRAKAVFDVEGVPTVCFLAQDGGPFTDAAAYDAIRQRIWNQNLVSIVLAIEGSVATVTPVGARTLPGESLSFAQARPDGPFSRADMQSGEVFIKRPDWFAAEHRVDRVLLDSLRIIVGDLQAYGLSKLNAQLLMAQVMFVAYLEHRGIAGDRYRRKHQVESLFTLVGQGDLPGISRLLAQLKHDFNGDLLEPEADGDFWQCLPRAAFHRLHAFLRRVDLASHQEDFWNYDFRFIPVELISGIYESFLSDDKRDVGAYYTPRHLAMMVVDLALSRSADLLNERIYDGACGSGILLTSAFRRLLGRAEAKQGRQLEFADRVDLLKRSIFGSDLNASACRVTAFSLYLSVLEGLDPADLAVLTAQRRSLLPKLQDGNLHAGGKGDFFSATNPHASAKTATIFLSNPPWVEPKKEVVLSSDVWAQQQALKIPRRQTAGAFLLRALDSVTPEATLCFILPVSLLAAPSSRDFMTEVLARYRIETLINFGDLRKLLFAAAKQPCMVLVARPRPTDQTVPSSGEAIEYWVPKADMSFAFGRLTLHGSDRHRVRAQSLAHNNELLTNLFWGSSTDIALLTTLRARGTFGGFLKSRSGWRDLKGFHAKDKGVITPPSSTPLRKIPYLDAKRFGVHGPLLDTSLLQPFPSTKMPTVARLPRALMEAFSGPRVVIADGMTPQREVKAGFSSDPFSFQSSLGAILAPPEDEDLLRFVALYLTSDLVRYGLLLSAYQVSFERERVALRDLASMPFVAPDRHPNPKRAWAIVREVAKALRTVERTTALRRADKYAEWRSTGQALIAEYMGLTDLQQARITEVIETVLSSVQPSAYGHLHTPLQHRPLQTDVQTYARTLAQELNAWRDSTHGSGRIHIDLIVNDRGVHGPLGILKLTPSPAEGPYEAIHTDRSDAAVQAVLKALRRQRLLPAALHENVYTAADVVIRANDSLYLIKPLLHRCWLIGEALRDAERVVRTVRMGTGA